MTRYVAPWLLQEIAAVTPEDDRVRPVLRTPIIEVDEIEDVAAPAVRRVRPARKNRSPIVRAVLGIIVERPGSSVYEVFRLLRRRAFRFVSRDAQHSIADALRALEHDGFVRSIHLTSPRDRLRAGASIIWEAVDASDHRSVSRA